jgi:hypothetical protein
MSNSLSAQTPKTRNQKCANELFAGSIQLVFQSPGMTSGRRGEQTHGKTDMHRRPHSTPDTPQDQSDFNPKKLTECDKSPEIPQVSEKIKKIYK